MNSDDRAAAVTAISGFITTELGFSLSPAQDQELSDAIGADLDSNKYSLQDAIDSNKTADVQTLIQDFPKTCALMQQVMVDHMYSQIEALMGSPQKPILN